MLFIDARESTRHTCTQKHRETLSFLIRNSLRTLPATTYIIYSVSSLPKALFSIARETEQRATGPWLRGYSRGAVTVVCIAPVFRFLSDSLFTCTYYHALAPPPGTEGEINERKVRRERS